MAYDGRRAIAGRELRRIVVAMHAALEYVAARGMAASFSCRRPHAPSALIAPTDLRALTAPIGQDRIVESSGLSVPTGRTAMTGLLFSARHRACLALTWCRPAVRSGRGPGCR